MLEIANVNEVSFTVTTVCVTYLGVCLYSMGTKHRHLRQLVVTTSTQGALFYSAGQHGKLSSGKTNETKKQGDNLEKK